MKGPRACFVELRALQAELNSTEFRHYNRGLDFSALVSASFRLSHLGEAGEAALQYCYYTWGPSAQGRVQACDEVAEVIYWKALAGR